MVPLKVTFLHFFDIHYLEEKGVSGLAKQIFKEANLATRFSLLSSDITIIPAAVYIESSICNRILKYFIPLIPYGIIRLIGNAYSYKEFCERKIVQYSNRPRHQQLYINALREGVEFPFLKRKRSSTQDIKDAWNTILNEEDIGKHFSCYDDLGQSSKFEKKWESIPSKLGKKAFIVPNVLKELFPDHKSNISIKNELHGIINPAYFRSYVNELNASVVTDLNILEPNYIISNNEINIPYKYILHELYKRNELESIAKQHPDDLMTLRSSEKWENIFFTACNIKAQNLSEFEKFHQLKVPQSSTIINYFANGDIKMGDTFNANQVGAQGINPHAHDMNFNQIWQKNNDIDLIALSEELGKLRLKLSEIANSAENHSEIGIVANAEIEAKNGNGVKVLELLSKTGKWTLGVAEKIGVSLVTSIIKGLFEKIS